MEAELIALLCLIGMIIIVSSILTKITTGRLCCNLRIVPLPVGEHSGNIPPAVGEHSRNIPPAENPDVFQNV
jgi:hypothetical protein